MFRFADLGRVWVPVDLPYPMEDGEDADVRIHLLVETFTDDELAVREREALEVSAKRLLDELRAAEEAAVTVVDGEQPRPRTRLQLEDLLRIHDQATAVRIDDRDTILDRTHDWRGIAGPENTPEPFTRDKLAALLQHRPILRAVRDAVYIASREGPRKNSSPGSGGSPERAQA